MGYHTGRRHKYRNSDSRSRMDSTNTRSQTMIREIICSDIFLLTLCIGIYVGATYLFKKIKWPIFHPVLITIAVLILFLYLCDIPYQRFKDATQILDFLLNLSVVALGYLLYEQIEHLKGHVISILTSIIIGSTIGILSTVYIAKWMGADDIIALSLAPKSITTPIAIAVSDSMGGITSLTSVVVVAVGIFGSIIAPFILDKIGIHDSIAKGLAIGSAAHGVGTARAIEIGALEGAVSGLAIGLMGIATALIVPLLKPMLF